MANGVKLDAPKQIIIDEAHNLSGARRKHTILVLFVQFSPASQIRSTLSIKIHKIFHIQLTQN